MFGGLRFVLALAVVFSHASPSADFHVGAASVMVFFLLAGYVMTHSFRVNFDGDLRRTGSFYTDRILRIYPLYAVSVLSVVAFCGITGYGRLYLDPRSILANVAVLPLNLVEHPIVPPAWSLGTEAQFYVLLPFVVRFRAVAYALLPASYAVFVLASLGALAPQRWGYTYSPGTLFLFLLGSLLYDVRAEGGARLPRVAVVGALVTGIVHLAALATRGDRLDEPYAFEVLTGFLLGTAALHIAGEARSPHRRIDDLLGRLSYPLFLGHVTVLYAFDHLRATGRLTLSERGAVALQLLASVAAAAPLALLDHHVQTVRKRVQTRSHDRRVARATRAARPGTGAVGPARRPA